MFINNESRLRKDYCSKDFVNNYIKEHYNIEKYDKDNNKNPLYDIKFKEVNDELNYYFDIRGFCMFYLDLLYCSEKSIIPSLAYAISYFNTYKEYSIKCILLFIHKILIENNKISEDVLKKDNIIKYSDAIENLHKLLSFHSNYDIGEFRYIDYKNNIKITSEEFKTLNNTFKVDAIELINQLTNQNDYDYDELFKYINNYVELIDAIKDNKFKDYFDCVYLVYGNKEFRDIELKYDIPEFGFFLSRLSLVRGFKGKIYGIDKREIKLNNVDLRKVKFDNNKYMKLVKFVQ